MAEETITILKVGTDEAVKNIADLRENVKVLKQALKELEGEQMETEEGWKQYQATLKELKINQNALKDAMYATSGSMDDLTNAATGTSESYNSLVHRMAALKEEMRSTDVATEEGKQRFKELAGQINEVNDKLKAMDELQGNFQRNVGNYPGSVGHPFEEAFGKMSEASGQLEGSLNSVNEVLKRTGHSGGLLSNVISGISTAAKLLASGKGILGAAKSIRTFTTAQKSAQVATEGETAALEGEAVAMNTATSATNKFKVALMSTGIGALLILLGELTAHAEELIDVVGNVDEETKKSLEDTKREIDAMTESLQDQVEMHKARGATAEESLNLELNKLLQLKDAYGDYTAAVIEEAGLSSEKTQEAWEKEKEIRAELNDQLKSAKYAMEGFVSAAETSKAQAGMTDLEKKIDNIHRTTRAYKKTLDTLFDQGLVGMKEYQSYLQRLRGAEGQMIDDATKTANKAAAAAGKAARDEAKRIAKAAADAYKSEEELLAEKYQEDLAKLKKYHLDTTNLTKKYNDDLAAIREKREQAEQKAEEEKQAAEQKRIADELKLAKTGEAAILKQQSDYANHMKAVSNATIDDAEERAEKEFEIQQKSNEDRIELLKQFSEAALARGDKDAYLNYQQEIADVEVQIEENTLKEKQRLRQKDLKDAQAKAKAQRDLMKEAAAATSDILGAIADMYESDEENAEKNAKKIKGLRIAAATIDTISGAIGAFMQASETIPPPYGQIIGAISAAAVTAAGIAQITQMKNTKVSGSEGGSSSPVPAVTSAPTINPDVANVRNVTSYSEEERLNRMASDQRVYILSSDIEASQNQIRTQVSESSF